MDIIFQHRLDEAFYPDILEILRLCDAEFVPALSKRTSAHQSTLTGADPSSPDGPRAYFEELKHQPFVLMVESGHVLGFLSSIPDYDLGFLDVGPGTSYVSTICVVPAMRGRDIGSRLYAYLEEVIRPRTVSIRTWSTNTAQIALLEKRGYERVRTIADDRGPGIDTVYFMKRL